MAVKKSRLELTIPESHPCYEDHFPGNPLLPGALLLQWLISRIEEFYAGITIVEVKSAKFLRAVRPGDHCELIFSIHWNNNLAQIECLRGKTTVCRCKLAFSNIGNA